MPLLEVSHLTKRFNRRRGWFEAAHVTTAVDDVSFSIDAGETFGLVGESGSGKTTTGRCILRLVEPTSGQVRFEGEDVLAFDPDRLRAARRRMQIVFQDPYGSLNPRLRVGTIVEEPLVIHRMENGRPFGSGHRSCFRVTGSQNGLCRLIIENQITIWVHNENGHRQILG